MAYAGFRPLMPPFIHNGFSYTSFSAESISYASIHRLPTRSLQTISRRRLLDSLWTITWLRFPPVFLTGLPAVAFLMQESLSPRRKLGCPMYLTDRYLFISLLLGRYRRAIQAKLIPPGNKHKVIACRRYELAGFPMDAALIQFLSEFLIPR